VEKAKQDDALSDLSDILTELKGMAIDMGSETGRQTSDLGHAEKDFDELNFRVKGKHPDPPSSWEIDRDDTCLSSLVSLSVVISGNFMHKTPINMVLIVRVYCVYPVDSSTFSMLQLPLNNPYAGSCITYHFNSASIRREIL